MAFDGPWSDSELRSRVLAEVEAISATPEFERAPVMRRLLSFLVRVTLDGGGDDLKAYSVAVDGLGRDPDFDSQSDSYPRVQVGRLRKMLDAYYSQYAQDCYIRLWIKTGGYKVDFVDPGDASLTEIVAVPVAPPAILPMRGLPPVGDPAPAWVTALTPGRVVFASIALILLLGALVLAISPSYRNAFLELPADKVTRAPVLELGVIDISAAPTQIAEGMRVRALLSDGLHRSWIARVRDAAGVPGSSTDPAEVQKADYRLAGQIVPAPQKGRFRLYLWLRETPSGNQIWSDAFLLPAEDVSLVEPLKPVISTLIRPFGVIATQERSRNLPKGTPGYRCLLEYEVYFRERNPALHAPVSACIRQTIALDPLNAPALAAASFLAFDPTSGPSSTAKAADFARRAVAADPYSAEAHVADARVAFIAGQCRRGTESANRAIALNAYTPELMGLLGYLLYQCDDPRAETWLQTAQALDPDIPAFYNVALVLSLLEHGKTEDALIIADSMRPPGPGMVSPYALIQTIASAARGDQVDARKQWTAAINASGARDGKPDAVIGRYLYSPNFRIRVIRYLTQKGVLPAQKPS